MSAFLKNKITDLENRINSLVIPSSTEDDKESKQKLTELNTQIQSSKEKLESLDKDFLNFKNLTNDNTKNTSTNLQTLSNNLNIINKNIEDMNYKKTVDALNKLVNELKTSNDNSTKKIETLEKNMKTLTDSNSALNKKLQSLEQKLSSGKQV